MILFSIYYIIFCHITVFLVAIFYLVLGLNIKFLLPLPKTDVSGCWGTLFLQRKWISFLSSTLTDKFYLDLFAA